MKVYEEILKRASEHHTYKEIELLGELAKRASVFFKPLKLEYFPNSQFSVVVDHTQATAMVASKPERRFVCFSVINDGVSFRRIDVGYSLKGDGVVSKMFSWECRAAIEKFADEVAERMKYE